MLKKILISIVVLLLIGLGIWKIFFSGDSISDKIEDVSKNLNSYNLEANMELINGEEKRNFNVKVSYLKDNEEDLFRVSLYDTNINQEQIMLRNKVGVYVLTPSLNQAYNFKSGWPLNSAKPYIYQSLLNVFNGDYDIEKMDDGFVVTSNISFKNSPSYSKQEVKFSNDLRPMWVNLYNDKDEVLAKVTFTKVETNVTFEENYFEVDKNMIAARENLVSGGNKEELELPLLLTGSDMNINLKDNVTTKIDGEELHMLVYEGDSNFTVLEKVCSSSSEIDIRETNGELVMTINGFAILEDNKVSYIYNNIEVIIYGEGMSVNAYFDVANGIEVSWSK